MAAASATIPTHHPRRRPLPARARSVEGRASGEIDGEGIVERCDGPRIPTDAEIKKLPGLAAGESK